MKILGLPGMLAPRYQELHDGAVNMVPSATSLHDDPGLFGSQRRFDALQLAITHMLHAVTDPVHMLFYRHQHVAPLRVSQAL